MWKVPPDFGMKAGDGLWYWLNQAIQHPTWSVHHAFLTNVVLPNFILFGYLTLLTEAFIGLSLTFGLFARLGGLVGCLMAINVTLSFSHGSSDGLHTCPPARLPSPSRWESIAEIRPPW